MPSADTSTGATSVPAATLATKHGLQDTEGVREQIATRGSLEQRDRGYVDDGHADPDDGQQEEGCSLGREQREQHQRDAPEQEAESEVGTVPAAPQPNEDERAADNPADADRGRQRADSGLAEPEQLERRDHDQDVQSTGNEVLRAAEHDDDPGSLVGRNGAGSGQSFGDETLARCGLRARLLPRRADRDQQERRDEIRRGRGDEDDADARAVEQRRTDQRSEKHPAALDHRQREIVRRQLLGCSR